MQVQSIKNFSSYNNFNKPSFQARVKLSPDDIVTLVKGGDVASGALATLGTSSSGSVVGSASSLGGSGFDTLATAFTLQASGSNSSGIVPAFMEHAGSSLVPSVLEATNAHPSAAGSIFSTIGNALKPKINIKVKDPS